MKTTKERFLEKIKKDPITGCWEWTASKDSRGYGVFQVDYKTDRAHRVSYKIFVGLIKHGLCICHKCDNPGCVNPDHLFAGTQSDNIKDAYQKGRLVNTFKIGHTTKRELSEDQVRAIKRELSKGDFKPKQIAQKLGVKAQTVRNIKSGLAYINVT